MICICLGVLCFLAIVLCSDTTFRGTLRTFEARIDTTIDGKIICHSDMLQKVTALSSLHCTEECGRSKGCVSFFYNKQAKSCQMHQNSFDISECTLQNEEDSRYHMMDRTKYKWEYMGCFKDTSDRNLAGEEMLQPHNSVTFCVFYCYQAGYKYSRLQGRVHYLCGDNYGRYGQEPETKCNFSCPANPTQMCGDDWANAVYATGL